MRGLGRSTFSSFAYRNFRLFFGGQIVSQVGNWLTLVTQTLLVYKLTNNGFSVVPGAWLSGAKKLILTDVKQDYSVGLGDFFKQTFTAASSAIVR